MGRVPLTRPSSLSHVHQTLMVVQMTAGKYNGGADAPFFGIVESLVGFRCSDNFPMLMVMFHMPVVVQ
jgi:hypothetical protein